jgi:septum site-determining protein MinC
VSVDVARQQRFRIQGRSFLAFVLAPEPPVQDWFEKLDDTLRRTAGFFAGRPMVLDVSGLALTKGSLRALLDALQERQIRILGLEGINESLVGPETPPVLKGTRPSSAVELPQRRVANAEADPRTRSLMIESPVRSGQSIVFLNGDVTVLGSIGSGAEVVAGGSIHVYGALRGRALAGAKGNPTARIFCTKAEAELLAIDSIYITADEIAASLRGRPAQVWLEGGSIRIASRD